MTNLDKVAAGLRDANEEIYRLRSDFKEAIRQRNELKAELAEARAQIKELTEPISDAGHTTADGLRHEMEQLRAQIAAYERAAKEGDTDPTTGRYTAEDIAHMKTMQLETLPKWAQNELIGLRAQIAAKDAALQDILQPFDELIVHAGNMVRWADIENAIDEAHRRFAAPAQGEQ